MQSEKWLTLHIKWEDNKNRLVCLSEKWILVIFMIVFTCYFYLFFTCFYYLSTTWKRCKNWPRHGDGSREALVIQGSGLPRCRCDAKKCATRCHEVQSELSQLTMHHQALQHGPPNRRDKLVQSCPNKQDYTLYDHYFKKMCNVQVASHEKMFAMWCHVQKNIKKLNMFKWFGRDLKRFEAFKILDQCIQMHSNAMWGVL